MESPPVSRPYFSPVRGKERFWLVLSWVVVAVCAAILYFYWDQTRTMALTNYFALWRSIKPVNYLFEFFSFLGNDEFYMLFFGILIWCVSKQLGFWTAAVLLVSGVVSGTVKDWTALERPAIDWKKQLESYAFPSGHTLTAVTVWGYMAVRLKKTGFWIWALVAMVMIALSRIVLGFHYLGDILGGFAMGIPVLLFLVWISALFVEKGWAAKFSAPLIAALCAVIPVVLTVLAPSGDMPKLMGLFAGASLGYFVEIRKVRAATSARWYFQVIKAVIGAAVLFGIVMGLSKVLASDNAALQVWLRFIRYGLGGVWVTLLAPALFVALKLTPREKV
jgi:membrane-associated phospholipid phosphatase